MVSPLQAELSPEPNKAILRSQCDHASYLSQFRSFYHHFRPYLHWYVVIRKLSILNNVSIVRNTRFQREGKEGRKEAITWCVSFISWTFHWPFSENSCLHHLWWKAGQFCHSQPNMPSQVTLGRISTKNTLWKVSAGLLIPTGGRSI